MLGPFLLVYKGPSDTRKERDMKKLAKISINSILKIVYKIVKIFVEWYEENMV